MTSRPFRRHADGWKYLSAILAVLGATPVHVSFAEWTPPEIRLPSPVKHPIIACTADELQRLRGVEEREQV